MHFALEGTPRTPSRGPPPHHQSRHLEARHLLLPQQAPAHPRQLGPVIRPAVLVPFVHAVPEISLVQGRRLLHDVQVVAGFAHSQSEQADSTLAEEYFLLVEPDVAEVVLVEGGDQTEQLGHCLGLLFLPHGQQGLLQGAG
jgi:hypothetical protein